MVRQAETVKTWARHRPLRVLVVDDDADTAESMTLLLRIYGHAAEAVSNGPLALEKARAQPPDVVLLDIALPVMDGYEVARRLRQQPGGKRPLLIAVTGYGREEDRRRSAEAGIDFHFVKPADIEQLEGVLRKFHRGIAGPEAQTAPPGRCLARGSTTLGSSGWRGGPGSCGNSAAGPTLSRW
jgi:CheY-like chemotaxis protein